MYEIRIYKKGKEKDGEIMSVIRHRRRERDGHRKKRGEREEQGERV